VRRNLLPDFQLASSQLFEIPRAVCQIFRSEFCRFRSALFVQQSALARMGRCQEMAYLTPFACSEHLAGLLCVRTSKAPHEFASARPRPGWT